MSSTENEDRMDPIDPGVAKPKRAMSKVDFKMDFPPQPEKSERPAEMGRRESARASLSRLKTNDQRVSEDEAWRNAEVFRTLVGMTVRVYANSTRTIIKPADPFPASAFPKSAGTELHNARELEQGTSGLHHITYEWKSSLRMLLESIFPLKQRRESSLYWTIVSDESRTRLTYKLCTSLFWILSIAQLVIAAVLVILGALPGNRHISVATLGAITGIITGVLSTIHKQGLPNRALQYKNALRHVREEIEWTERNIRAGARCDPYAAADSLRLDYNKAREDKNSNLPENYVTYENKTFGHQWQKERDERASAVQERK